MSDPCPDCDAIRWGNATCATCRSHWPDEPDCHEGNVGANIAGGRYSSAAKNLGAETTGDKTTRKSLAGNCPNCHGTGTTRYGICAYCKGTGQSQ